MAHMPDTHRFLLFNMTHTGSEDFHYVDIAREVSKINRRLYRQGRMYHIANVSVHDSDGDAFVRICTLPNTWMTRTAWNKGFKAWRKQRSLALGDIDGSVTGRWSDFKVWFNDDHRTDTDKLLPVDVEDDLATTGEWIMASLYTDANNNGVLDEFDLHMMGADNGSHTEGTMQSAGLINAFSDVKLIPSQSPVPNASINSGLYAYVAGVGYTSADEILDDIEDENDYPPYPTTAVSGADGNQEDGWVVRECHIASEYSPIAMLGGFAAPLGLLQIETRSAVNGNVIGLLIELAPGPYKGILAERY